MPRITNLYRKLKDRGLTVEYVPGWSTRGSESFAPKGVMAHWTAGPRGTQRRASLNICTYGRPGLPGPLCNVYLDRKGVAVIVAAGRANHAGYGLWKGVTGNTGFFGIEAEAADNDDWTPEQRAAYPLVCAGLLDAIGETDASFVCSHAEYALPRGRKIDVNGYEMPDLRDAVQAVLRGITAEDLIPAGLVTPKPSIKPVPKVPQKKRTRQSVRHRPGGGAPFPTDYDNLFVDKDFGVLTVGAIQILMENIKIGVRHNLRWSGAWNRVTIMDVMEWLQSNGYYKHTQFAKGGVPAGAKLVVDGVDGYWFWYEFQRFLKTRGHYDRALDGDPRGWTVAGVQQYLNTQNGN